MTTIEIFHNVNCRPQGTKLPIVVQRVAAIISREIPCPASNFAPRRDFVLGREFLSQNEATIWRFSLPSISVLIALFTRKGRIVENYAAMYITLKSAEMLETESS